MKHFLVGAFAGISLLACGSEVIIDSDPSGGAGGSGGGASVTIGASASASAASGSVSIDANGCEMSCNGKGQSTCSCRRECAGGFTKTACKPDSSGRIECVCTVNSGTFSGACYEKKDAACDFDEGCCANYFMGK